MSKLRTDELENLSGSVTILVANLLQSSDLTATNTTYDNTSSGLTATDVQDAIDEVDSNLDSTDSSLSSHTGDDTIHRTINDAGTATTDLWSADKIGTELSGKLDTTAQAADSDLLDGQEGTYYLDRANHTGTNDADTLDGQDSPYYLDRTNHTGTQTLSTISDSGTAASADITTSATDTTAGRVTRVGDFGLGEYGQPSSDLNTIMVGGYYITASPGQAEAPNGGQVGSIGQVNFLVHHFAYDADSALQIATPLPTNEVYTRSNINGTWEEWSLLYGQDNILGTVSQSSGVPTGAIIEQGSNSNGAYTKFADGTMICQHTYDLTQATANACTGTWIFPVEFASGPRTLAMMDEGNSSITPPVREVLSPKAQNQGLLTQVGVAVRTFAGAASSFGASDTVRVWVRAYGFWF